MTTSPGSARHPQELERLLIERQWEGDIDGMVELYEPDAVLDDGSGELAVGRDAIRSVLCGLVEAGRRFEAGDQQKAIVCGGVALTSTRLSDGCVTAEVARRQPDGSWLWAIDKFSVT